MNLDDPIATALRVARLLERAEVAYGLYGGLAVAAYGVARETKDADVAVVAADLARLVDLLTRDGLHALPTFDQVRLGGLIVSRATLVGGEGDTGLNTVDLVEPASSRYASLAVGRAVRAPLRDGEICLLAPEDVVIFKLLSTREKDLEDGSAIMRQLAEALDVAMIDAEVARLVNEVPQHDLDQRWERCRSSG